MDPKGYPLRLSNDTGILQKIKRHQSATPFLSGAPPPRKNPGSAPDWTPGPGVNVLQKT